MDNPTCINPLESMRYFLTESPQSMWFRWLLILPVLCLTVSALHFSKFSQSRFGSICLFSFEVLLAIATWLTVQAIAIFATLPLVYSFKNMRDHLYRHSSGTPSFLVGDPFVLNCLLRYFCLLIAERYRIIAPVKVGTSQGVGEPWSPFNDG